MTPRQQETAALLAQGLTDKVIATRLGISYGSAKYHVASVKKLLGAKNRTHAGMLAARTPRAIAPPKPLHVHRFTNGAVGITCAGMALHLNPDESQSLHYQLDRLLYPERWPA